MTATTNTTSNVYLVTYYLHGTKRMQFQVMDRNILNATSKALEYLGCIYYSDDFEVTKVEKQTILTSDGIIDTRMK